MIAYQVHQAGELVTIEFERTARLGLRLESLFATIMIFGETGVDRAKIDIQRLSQNFSGLAPSIISFMTRMRKASLPALVNFRPSVLRLLFIHHSITQMALLCLSLVSCILKHN